jgi:hypothetical protein
MDRAVKFQKIIQHLMRLLRKGCRLFASTVLYAAIVLNVLLICSYFVIKSVLSYEQVLQV